MNCTTCGYALWNLRTRQCPECGDRFAPSQFEFVLNSVAFCCPHCDQAYYGTGAKGHLVPQEFHCVKCGELVNMDLMVVRPAEGVRERETQVDTVPWLSQEKGWIKPFFRTVGLSLVMPHKIGRGLRADQPVFQAWLFAAIAQAAIVVAFMAPVVIFFGIVANSFGGGGLGPTLGGMIGGIAYFAVGLFAAAMIGIACWGALAHLLLRVTGPLDAAIGRTYECICYSSGANAGTAVPCLGFYFGWIWWAISAVLLLKEGQRVSGWRAALAGILPPILAVGLFIGGYAALIAYAMQSTAGGMVLAPPVPPPTVPAGAQTAASNLVQNLRTYGWNRTPAHAAELIEDDFASPAMFLVSSSNTTLDDVPLGQRTLRDLDAMLAAERTLAIAQAVAALPQNVIAHRLGDFVFTYHGIDLSPAGTTDSLWLLIASPDPDSNEAESFNGVFFVASTFGATTSILEGRFDEELAEQNRVRATRGLAPLPHPREITHTQPAVGDQRAAPRRRR